MNLTANITVCKQSPLYFYWKGDAPFSSAIYLDLLMRCIIAVCACNTEMQLAQQATCKI